MAVFLELGKPAEADLLERQDHAGGLKLLPGRDQIPLRDFGVAVDDFLWPRANWSEPALDFRSNDTLRRRAIAASSNCRPKRGLARRGVCGVHLGRNLAHRAVDP